MSFFMVAMIVTMSLSAYANTWSSEDVELTQHTYEEESSNISDEFVDYDSDYSPWKFISTVEDICENAYDIKTLVEDIKNTYVKTDKREFVVSDVQVLKDNTSLASTDGILNINDADNMAIKVFYDEGEGWVEIPIGKHQESEFSTMSINGNQYGFILPLDRSDLLTNCLTCRFGCEVNGVLCQWCRDNNKGYANRIHNGLDMSWTGIAGANIRAVSDGTVECRGLDPNDSGWGNYVKIKHSNNSTISTLYAHMQSPPLVYKNNFVNQGTIIGKVGHTGKAYGDHLHFEVYINNTRVDPLPYLQGAVPYGSSDSGSDPDLYLYAPGKYIICDGPVNIRGSASTTSQSYGTVSNGTTLTISEIQKGNNSYVFGKISSGDYTNKWVALGKADIELYAANTSVTWTVFDGPLNVRQSASTSSQSYGTIANDSTFKITDVVTGSGYIFAKIATSPSPVMAGNSTCTVENAKNHWVALNYCKPI